MVQWLRLHTPNAGGLGSIPGQETRSHMSPLRVYMLQLKKKRKEKILHVTPNTRYSQINKYFFKNLTVGKTVSTDCNKNCSAVSGSGRAIKTRVK